MQPEFNSEFPFLKIQQYINLKAKFIKEWIKNVKKTLKSQKTGNTLFINACLHYMKTSCWRPISVALGILLGFQCRKSFSFNELLHKRN